MQGIPYSTSQMAGKIGSIPSRIILTLHCFMINCSKNLFFCLYISVRFEAKKTSEVPNSVLGFGHYLAGILSQVTSIPTVTFTPIYIPTGGFASLCRCSLFRFQPAIYSLQILPERDLSSNRCSPFPDINYDI